MVVIEEGKTVRDEHLLVKKVSAAISDGTLAQQIAQQASLNKCKCISNDGEHELDDDDDDDEEETYMNSLRREAKLISDTAASNGCLPASGVQKLPPKAPLESISLLQDVIDTIGEIMMQPITHDKPPVANRITHASVKQEEDVSQIASSAPTQCSFKPPALPKTTRSRPDQPKVAKTPPSTPTPPPGKPSRPTSRGQSKSLLKLQKSIKPVSYFHMDASGDELDVPTASATVRGSSLTRAYDALEVPHCRLDDDSDVEQYDARQSKISVSYEALGATFPSPASRPASPAGDLPPVKPVRRGVPAAPKPPFTKIRSGPSAMELDLGMCENEVHCNSNTREWTCMPMQQNGAPLGSRIPFSRPSSKQGASLSLPKLPCAKVAGDSLNAKSVPMMKSGTAGTTLWGVTPIRSFVEWDTQQLIS